MDKAVTNCFIIYFAFFRDLLSDDPSYKMEVKMNPDGGLYVPGLSFVDVNTVEDVNEVMYILDYLKYISCLESKGFIIDLLVSQSDTADNGSIWIKQ
jgi:hypothetical protein